MKAPYAPLHREGDSTAMTLAITRLFQLQVDLHRTSPHQLKVGSWNFYPSKGTINADANPAIRERGLGAFIVILDDHGLLPS